MQIPLNELLDSFGLLLEGMAFVLIVLGLLYGICSAVGLFFRQGNLEKAQDIFHTPAHLFSHHQHPTAQETEIIDIPFVLAAAVDRMMAGTKYRILKVQEVSPTRSDWAREGRRSLFTSHRIR